MRDVEQAKRDAERRSKKEQEALHERLMEHCVGARDYLSTEYDVAGVSRLLSSDKTYWAEIAKAYVRVPASKLKPAMLDALIPTIIDPRAAPRALATAWVRRRTPLVAAQLVLDTQQFRAARALQLAYRRARALRAVARRRELAHVELNLVKLVYALATEAFHIGERHRFAACRARAPPPPASSIARTHTHTGAALRMRWSTACLCSVARRARPLPRPPRAAHTHTHSTAYAGLCGAHTHSGSPLTLAARRLPRPQRHARGTRF